MRLRSKTASKLSQLFSPKSQRRYHQIYTLKHIMGVSGKRSTPAADTVTERKNNFAPPPPVPPQGLFKSFFGLVFLGSILTLFLALRAVSI